MELSTGLQELQALRAGLLSAELDGQVAAQLDSARAAVAVADVDLAAALHELGAAKAELRHHQRALVHHCGAVSKAAQRGPKPFLRWFQSRTANTVALQKAAEQRQYQQELDTGCSKARSRIAVASSAVLAARASAAIASEAMTAAAAMAWRLKHAHAREAQLLDGLFDDLGGSKRLSNSEAVACAAVQRPESSHSFRQLCVALKPSRSIVCRSSQENSSPVCLSSGSYALPAVTGEAPTGAAAPVEGLGGIGSCSRLASDATELRLRADCDTLATHVSRLRDHRVACHEALQNTRHIGKTLQQAAMSLEKVLASEADQMVPSPAGCLGRATGMPRDLQSSDLHQLQPTPRQLPRQRRASIQPVNTSRWWDLHNTTSARRCSTGGDSLYANPSPATSPAPVLEDAKCFAALLGVQQAHLAARVVSQSHECCPTGMPTSYIELLQCGACLGQQLDHIEAALQGCKHDCSRSNDNMHVEHLSHSTGMCDSWDFGGPSAMLSGSDNEQDTSALSPLMLSYERLPTTLPTADVGFISTLHQAVMLAQDMAAALSAAAENAAVALVQARKGVERELLLARARLVACCAKLEARRRELLDAALAAAMLECSDRHDTGTNQASDVPGPSADSDC